MQFWQGDDVSLQVKGDKSLGFRALWGTIPLMPEHLPLLSPHRIRARTYYGAEVGVACDQGEGLRLLSLPLYLLYLYTCS